MATEWRPEFGNEETVMDSNRGMNAAGIAMAVYIWLKIIATVIVFGAIGLVLWALMSQP